MTKAERAIKAFRELDNEISKEKTVTVEPKELKIILKKIYLGAKPLLENIHKAHQYRQKNKKYKSITKHKKETQENIIYTSATELISGISKVHQKLTNMLYYHSNNITMINNDHTLKIGHMSDILKERRIRDTFDTDEIAALYVFNSLRNSMIHSSNYKTFNFVTKDYYLAIAEVLDNVQTIYSWLNNKKEPKKMQLNFVNKG